MRKSLVVLWAAFPAAFLSSLGLPAPARADGAPPALCGHMLMPAVALKELSRGFGPTGRHGFHTGVDLTAPYGSPVRAPAAGVVVYAGWYFEYGNIIDLRHQDGIVTRYAHLSSFAQGITPGATVAEGAVIGSVGTSGRAHGAHLHFEVRIDGRAIDPRPFLALASCDGVKGPEPIEEARAR